MHGPPQQVHDGVIVAEDDKSSHTQSRTTASTNSCFKRSRRKVGMDNAYICVYAGRFIPGTEDAILKGMQDDESLRTCTHSGVKKRTGKRVCVDKCSYIHVHGRNHTCMDRNTAERMGMHMHRRRCKWSDADSNARIQTQVHKNADEFTYVCVLCMGSRFVLTHPAIEQIFKDLRDVLL